MLQRSWRQAAQRGRASPKSRGFGTSSTHRSFRLLLDESNPTTSQQKSDSTGRTIFSGIQPTGVPHLGNYLGAISQWVELQKNAAPNEKLYFSIVDLHSLTTRDQSPEERRLARRQTLAVLLAASIDPDKCTIFYQSSVPQHAELQWMLSCIASVGALARMPTWKEKLAPQAAPPSPRAEDTASPTSFTDVSTALLSNDTNPSSAERFKLGLFAYPVLQAADILLYNTTHVPVGADQLVHIELARNLASQFNHFYGNKSEILKLPTNITTSMRRVMSLTEPQKKMSKSAINPRSRVLVTDSDAQIRKKFAAALTDSEKGITYEPEKRPGLANLLEIVAALNGGERDLTPQDFVSTLNNIDAKGSSMAVLKKWASDGVCKTLAPLREEYERLMSGGQAAERELDDIVERGRQVATAEAEKTMKIVREAVGIS